MPVPQHYWNDSFKLNVPEIDAQHKVLFDLLYELDCAIASGKAISFLNESIERLQEYCQRHFATEEKLMLDHGYPEFHMHLLQHDDFTRSVIELGMQKDLAPRSVPARISELLRDWLIKHIAVEDRGYIPWVLATGGKREAGLAAPILLEVESTAHQSDAAICTRVAALLQAQQKWNIPVAASLDQVRAILTDLKSLGINPGIFVVNTYGAKSLLLELDVLMGELPVLYLRRSLFAGRSGLMDVLNAQAGQVTATTTLDKMRPRLTSMWFYGARNTEEIALRTAEAIITFVRTGDFKQVERLRPANSA